MLVYHQVWLDSHPHRSKVWFETRIKEGFEVHHVDGNRNNNHPDNLVLLDIVDHKKFHGALVLRHYPKKIDMQKGEIAYYARVTTLRAWDFVAAVLKMSTASAMNHARVYAKAHNLPWPLAVIKTSRGHKRPVYTGLDLAPLTPIE